MINQNDIGKYIDCIYADYNPHKVIAVYKKSLWLEDCKGIMATHGNSDEWKIVRETEIPSIRISNKAGTIVTNEPESNSILQLRRAMDEICVILDEQNARLEYLEK